ncbi:MAG TPA: hypothetical protein VF069_06925 [Streptosporangiaceae bacterium]
MPVSRGRKSKKGGKKKNSRRSGGPLAGPSGGVRYGPGDPLAPLRSLMGPPSRPAWFDQAIKNVLEQADDLVTSPGPRELEQATAELLGGELYQVVHDEDSTGLWFDWWFAELAEAAATRAGEDRTGNSGRRGPWWLLHGLTAVGSPALRTKAQAALGRARNARRADASSEAEGPDWLGRLNKVGATGEVWSLRDAYGTRLAVVAGVDHTGGGDTSAFLFDIDACGMIELVGAGGFDDVEQAATAWRSAVGDTAAGASPTPVDKPDDLHCLVQWDSGEAGLKGDEPRGLLDNWFLARRRVHDIAVALRGRGMRLPEVRSLFIDLDTAPAAEAFTRWYEERHGTAPNQDVVQALAEEWLEGCLPSTEHAVSPHRVRHRLTLINDWQPDHPVTVGARSLLPEWARWHGEQSGLPEELVERSVAAADAPGGAVTCGGVEHHL